MLLDTIRNRLSVPDHTVQESTSVRVRADVVIEVIDESQRFLFLSGKTESLSQLQQVRVLQRHRFRIDTWQTVRRPDVVCSQLTPKTAELDPPVPAKQLHPTAAGIATAQPEADSDSDDQPSHSQCVSRSGAKKSYSELNTFLSRLSHLYLVICPIFRRQRATAARRSACSPPSSSQTNHSVFYRRSKKKKKKIHYSYKRENPAYLSCLSDRRLDEVGNEECSARWVSRVHLLPERL